MKQKLINGDCIEELKKLPDNSIDSIVTDPPYHLSTVKRFSKKDSGDNWNVKSGVFHRGSKGFMGKEWDGGDIAFKPEVWYECLRVLKPGGHILSFGGTRTYHRMAVAIEDAGFEILDCIFWCYGSGFPKSHNIGKAVDKKMGNERIKTGEIKKHAQKGVAIAEERGAVGGGAFGQAKEEEITKGNSKWEGWGTALKPAVEPVVLGRKPLSEKTIAENVLKHGTGGLNIDGSRVGNEERTYDLTMTSGNFETTGGGKNKKQDKVTTTGRFPANIILDKEAGKILDEQSGDTGCSSNREKYKGKKYGKSVFLGEGPEFNSPTYTDKGGASRYFKEISLKPEVEPVVLGRKPLSEKTIAENVLKHGTGGLNIDDSRVGNEEIKNSFAGNKETGFTEADNRTDSGKGLYSGKNKGETIVEGRFPANFIHDGSDEVVDKFPENKATAAGKKGSSGFASGYDGDYEIPYGDSGSAARYFKEIEGDRIFYTAKASKSERNNGLEGFEEKPSAHSVADKCDKCGKFLGASANVCKCEEPERVGISSKNNHPTVKPVKLMRYLIKLITPPNGTVLDPFMGSGTTGIAAKLEGFNFVGIEKEEEYIKIAEARIKNYKKENPKKKIKAKKKKVKKVKSEFWK